MASIMDGQNNNKPQHPWSVIAVLLALGLPNVQVNAGQQSQAPKATNSQPDDKPTVNPASEEISKHREKAAAASNKPATHLNEGGYSSKQVGIAGNPGAVNVLTGTGWLGRTLGLTEDTGVRLGGLWIGNADIQMSGRLPGSASFNSMGIVDLQLDLARLGGIPGASFAATFLQFDGQDSNGRAGVLTGYNGLTEMEPLNRSELYQFWWRQSLLDDKLIVRAGKSIPTFDFNNISRRLPVPDEKPYVAAVTGLLFTPIYVNPSILGVMPGYYNSAWGLTVTAAPTKALYASYGIYDGSLARGRQTGTHAWPTFNSYYFNIGEAGFSWIGDYPGKVAVGGWGQSGTLGTGDDLESGAQGIYATASNRLWNLNLSHGKGVVLGYLQYGINNSHTMMVNEFVGAGLSGFGLIPGRDKDSLGMGIGVSWLNNPPRSQSTEILTQFYYQAHVIGGVFFQPTFSYVPNPGIPNGPYGSYPSATSMIFQLVTLF
ncbi:MAG: carbohydrate porin [Pseudomonadota bacterium]|jgi:porin